MTRPKGLHIVPPGNHGEPDSSLHEHHVPTARIQKYGFIADIVVSHNQEAGDIFHYVVQPEHSREIIFWGQDDVFFTREGGEVFLKDLPEAEMHRLDAGHFAVEDHLDYISSNIHRFHAESVTSLQKKNGAR